MTLFFGTEQSYQTHQRLCFRFQGMKVCYSSTANMLPAFPLTLFGSTQMLLERLPYEIMTFFIG